MTPELIIAVTVCLKVGKAVALHGGSPAAQAGTPAVAPAPEPEAFRKMARDLAVTGLPVVGAYGEPVPFAVRREWNQFWLVCPLDGADGDAGESTVSVALVEGGDPVLGVVYAPAIDELYCASRESGAYRVRFAGTPFAETTRLQPAICRELADGPSVCRLLVGSAHLDEHMQEYVDGLAETRPGIRIVRGDGMLNFCRVASGEAELYPRLEVTAEWETAAGHAILRSVGKGLVEIATGLQMRYNKPDLRNPHFLAR